MLTSSWLCYVTTSARTSWNLPPEDLLDAAYIPSLWAVQKTVLMVLTGIIIGPLAIADILEPRAIVHLSVALVISPDRAVENSPLCCGMR